jgi:predicted acyl esterase
VAYETGPFREKTEISGFPSLTLWMTLDVPDADIVAELYEITQEGKSILLDDARLRMRYRNSLAKPELLTPGKPTKVELDRFRFMSRLLAAGSRIRLVVRSPATVDLQVNYQSGKAVAFETAGDARRSRLKLHHEPRMGSVLTLPITEQ